MQTSIALYSESIAVYQSVQLTAANKANENKREICLPK